VDEVGGQVIDGPEFSRELEIARVPVGGRAFAIAATEAERAAIADRFDLVAVAELRASGRVAWLPGGEVLTVEGRLDAEVTQRCVLTLEPVRARLSAPLRRSFVSGAADAAEVVLDPEADEPEPVRGGRLDLGEIVAEELALNLDPYPRASTAEAARAPVGAAAEADGAAPRPGSGGAG
jgi:hypothetical protein